MKGSNRQGQSEQRSAGMMLAAATVLASGLLAGCTEAAERGEGEGGPLPPNSAPAAGSMTVLDARAAAELDARHEQALAAAFATPGTCYSFDLDGGGLVRLNVQDGTATRVDGFDDVYGQMVNAMGHFGGALVTCQPMPDGGSGVLLYDLDAKSIKAVPMECESATGDGYHLWVTDPGYHLPWERRIREYDNLAQLVANQPSRTLPAPSAFGFGVGYGRLMSAWHSTDEVILVDMKNGSQTISPLQGYDDWIFGMSEAFGERYMVGGWTEDVRGLHVFDQESGAGKGRLFADRWLAGLTCDAR